MVRLLLPLLGLLFCGIIPASYSLDLQKELGSRVTIVVIPKAAHAMLPEQPEGVADAIAGWMSRFR